MNRMGLLQECKADTLENINEKYLNFEDYNTFKEIKFLKQSNH